MSFSWILFGAVFFAGALVAWLWLRAAAGQLRARLEEANTRLSELSSVEARLREEITDLQQTISTLRERGAADREKTQWLDDAQRTLREAFDSLAAQALKNNSGEITRQARENFQGVVSPLQDNLKALSAQVQAMEEKRAGAYGSLGTELKKLSEAQSALRTTTDKLSEALTSHTTRGRWGEIQLRRVVELAGMQEHVDFDEQSTSNGQRPDMIIHLPGGGEIPIDAKAPLDAYLEATETRDPERRKAKMKEHARAVRARVRELSRREYWKQFEHAAEFVVMFVPNESCLVAAFEEDGDLLDFAMGNQVLICAPINLLALLRAAAYGWQQQKIADNARQIAEEGKILHDRLARFVGYLGEVGRAAGKTVELFNKAVGSYERRIQPSLDRFEDLAAMEARIDAPEASRAVPRSLPVQKGLFPGDEKEGPESSEPAAPGAAPREPADPHPAGPSVAPADPRPAAPRGSSDSEIDKENPARG